MADCNINPIVSAVLDIVCDRTVSNPNTHDCDSSHLYIIYYFDWMVREDWLMTSTLCQHNFIWQTQTHR